MAVHDEGAALDALLAHRGRGGGGRGAGQPGGHRTHDEGAEEV